MKVIIGTYRKKAYITQCLDSLYSKVSGFTEVHFVDDSGDRQHREWLSNYGDVHAVGINQSGYNAAMRQVCAVANGEEAMFLEEDFTFCEDVDLQEMKCLLLGDTTLAQVALLRQPWFEIEKQHGGVIEALQKRGHKFTTKENGLIYHTATFTCNPAVWRGEVFTAGWPRGNWSEERKQRELMAQGYQFAYMPGIKTTHWGERSGFDY